MGVSIDLDHEEEVDGKRHQGSSNDANISPSSCRLGGGTRGGCCRSRGTSERSSGYSSRRWGVGCRNRSERDTVDKAGSGSSNQRRGGHIGERRVASRLNVGLREVLAEAGDDGLEGQLPGVENRGQNVVDGQLDLEECHRLISKVY